MSSTIFSKEFVYFCKRSQRCPHRKESVVREHENSKFVKAALCELKVGVPPLNLCRPELCVFSGMYQSVFYYIPDWIFQLFVFVGCSRRN